MRTPKYNVDIKFVVEDGKMCGDMAQPIPMTKDGVSVALGMLDPIKSNGWINTVNRLTRGSFMNIVCFNTTDEGSKVFKTIKITMV